MSLDLSCTVTGSAELIATLGELGGDVRKETAAFLHDEAEAIIGDSRENYVPVEYAILKNSGVALNPEWDGDTCTNALGYGGAASAYALAVHEHLSAHSPASWRAAEAAGHPVQFSQQGPKYLERPFLARIAGMADRLADRLRAAIAKRGKVE